MATIDVKDAVGATQTLERPLVPGRAAATASRPVVLSNEDILLLGSVTETAPVTDTGSSGISGRLQRIAQRITSMIGVLPAALGAGGGLKVDGSGTALAVSGTVTANIGTGTLATVTTVSTVSNVGTIGTSVTPGTGATNLGKAEDSAHTTGDTGVMVLAVRQDAEAALAGTTGDYIPLSVDANGYLRCTFDPRQTEGAEYETVAALATDQAIGASGQTGDYLSHVIVFPAIAAAGAVTIKDNTTVWGTFAGGGTTALPTLVPFTINVGVNSVNGPWKITTGANVACVAIGNFT